MMKSTKSYFMQIKRLKAAIDTADAIIVGAGAGLSASAGFTYNGARFHQYFSDFEAKYGFHDMYTGGFYPFQTLEEYWAYWSRNVYINRYLNTPKPLYEDLLQQIGGKDYFVVTTNVDHCFQKAGFDKTRLFYTQGDYGLFQCSAPCNTNTYENEAAVRRMIAEQINMKIPAALIPKCPQCGRPLTVNLRTDEKFVEDKGWIQAAKRYENFLLSRQNQKILFLELGVGYNTPGIIKYPFWQMTAQNPKAVYACINEKEAVCPHKIEARSICLEADIGTVFNSLKVGGHVKKTGVDISIGSVYNKP